MIQVHVPKGMGVQLPPSAPTRHENTCENSFFAARNCLTYHAYATADRAHAKPSFDTYSHAVLGVDDNKKITLSDNISGQLTTEQQSKAWAFKVIGVGGAGCNTLRFFEKNQIGALALTAIDTDAQTLESISFEKLQIGHALTRGLSTGNDFELGRKAADADRKRIKALCKGQDIIFIVAGLGGGLGSSAASIVAECAVEQGSTVIAFVNMPFSFEGGTRYKQAEKGLIDLRAHCEAVIPLPNDILLQSLDNATTVLDAFARSNTWMHKGICSLVNMLVRPGMIHVDLATLQKIFIYRGGKTLFGLASGEGNNALKDAIKSFSKCPLLSTPEHARKADALVVSITSDNSLTLDSVKEILTAISDLFGGKENVVLGTTLDPSFEKKIEIVVLGTTLFQAYQQNVIRLQPQESKAQTDLPLFSENATLLPTEDRGVFEATSQALFNGEDLDVPSYIRNGIKLHV